MDICIYVYIRICTCVYICIYVYIHICIYVYKYVCRYVYVYLYTCIVSRSDYRPIPANKVRPNGRKVQKGEQRTNATTNYAGGARAGRARPRRNAGGHRVREGGSVPSGTLSKKKKKGGGPRRRLGCRPRGGGGGGGGAGGREREGRARGARGAGGAKHGW